MRHPGTRYALTRRLLRTALRVVAQCLRLRGARGRTAAGTSILQRSPTVPKQIEIGPTRATKLRSLYALAMPVRGRGNDIPHTHSLVLGAHVSATNDKFLPQSDLRSPKLKASIHSVSPRAMAHCLSLRSAFNDGDDHK